MNEQQLSWLIVAGVVLLTGTVGGIANAMMNSGERYRLPRPFRPRQYIELGFLGPVFIGIVAALAASLFYLDAKPHQLALACLLAAISGTNFLNRLQAQNLLSATQETAQALKDVTETFQDLAAQKRPGDAKIPSPDPSAGTGGKK